MSTTSTTAATITTGTPKQIAYATDVRANMIDALRDQIAYDEVSLERWPDHADADKWRARIARTRAAIAHMATVTDARYILDRHEGPLHLVKRLRREGAIA